MKKILLLNPEGATNKKVKEFQVREAVRAIVLNEDNKVALLRVLKYDYYKIPGGGIEKDEDRITALRRECLEEIGAEIEIVGEVGMIVEYRKSFNLKQTSYCYLARLKGKSGNSKFTEDEIRDKFEPIWLSYKEALRKFSIKTTSFEGRVYIMPREYAFLKEAQKLIKS